MLTPIEIRAILNKKTVAVIGAGGLGGFVLESLARLNFKEIRIFDGDSFSESNLDRQLYSNINNLSQMKAEEGAKRISLISKDIRVKVYTLMFLEKHAPLLEGADIVFDCTDNIATRFILEAVCERLNIPLVHGAINDTMGQISLILPKDSTISRLYKNQQNEKNKTLAFIPSATASLMVSEGVKHLTAQGETLSGGKILIIDFLTNDFRILKV
ncbi:MAG: HesA/MoeB/ThiF family protein [Firmicutes bacterium]|nr:HesA/MoeB/ThiF family protein [Bacillota bacterium]